MSQIRCNLTLLRKRRHLKQTDLARLAGLSQKALSELETGKSRGISFNTLSKLCQVLEVGPEQLFELVPDDAQPGVSIARVAQLLCSFCGKGEKEVAVLIVAKPPEKTPVHICSECIVRCHGLLQEELQRTAASAAR